MWVADKAGVIAPAMSILINHDHLFRNRSTQTSHRNIIYLGHWLAPPCAISELYLHSMDAPQRLPRRRNGRLQACETCRNMKIKCDHARPPSAADVSQETFVVSTIQRP